MAVRSSLHSLICERPLIALSHIVVGTAVRGRGPNPGLLALKA